MSFVMPQVVFTAATDTPAPDDEIFVGECIHSESRAHVSAISTVTATDAVFVLQQWLLH